jgi:hypothetical protein
MCDVVWCSVVVWCNQCFAAGSCGADVSVLRGSCSLRLFCSPCPLHVVQPFLVIILLMSQTIKVKISTVTIAKLHSWSLFPEQKLLYKALICKKLHIQLTLPLLIDILLYSVHTQYVRQEFRTICRCTDTNVWTSPLRNSDDEAFDFQGIYPNLKVPLRKVYQIPSVGKQHYASVGLLTQRKTLGREANNIYFLATLCLAIRLSGTVMRRRLISMAQRRMIDDWADEEFLPAKLCFKQRS